jgi:3-oxoacyl-[acyl-carrier protein] reductase
MASQMDSSARDALIARQLLKKPAQPVDIANTALFLGSDLATHITGQVIRVDGGLI